MKRTLRFAPAALLVVLLAGLFAPFATPGTALAHPLGNFTINRYARVELYRGGAIVHYVLDFAEIPAFQLKADVDANGDDRFGEDELAAFLPRFAEDVADNITFTLDGAPVPLRLLDATATVSTGQASLDVIRIAFVFAGETTSKRTAEAIFRDENYEGRPGWREIVVRPAPDVAADIPGEFLSDRSDALRAYPEDALDTPPSQDEAMFAWDPSTGFGLPAAARAESGEATSGGGGRLARLLERDGSLAILFLGMVAAFGFGALHALGPGHGKSVVAAYLVGTRGTPRHALALGVTVTATHTAAVYGLGFVTLVASDLIAPDRLFLYLGVLSGLLIVVMGIGLFVSRLHRLMTRTADSTLHRHGLFGRPHSHLPGHTHDEHHHDHEHHHHGEHEHDNRHAGSPAYHHAAPQVSWRGLLTLGVAGGIIPCPSALVVMLAAISLGQVLLGMLLIVAFSFGLAGVLVAIGLALVLGRRLSGRAAFLRRPAFERAFAVVPVASALAVTVAGLAITYQALNQPGL